MPTTDLETLTRRLSGRRVGPIGVKAGRYVVRFFNRRRVGLKIVADVEGNHGTHGLDVYLTEVERFNTHSEEGVATLLAGCVVLGFQGGCL